VGLFLRGIGMGKKRCGEDGREVSDDATEAFIYAKRILQQLSKNQKIK
jgi:hypothetical protein